MDSNRAYQAKEELLVKQILAMNKHGQSIEVEKRTSNLFRARKSTDGPRLDFKNLNQVTAIDAKAQTAEVEAATTYEDLVDATLAFGLMPAVVPQFTTITLGGAVSGGACEASSFKYGAVHETVLEMTVLLADGRVVLATATNGYKDLFFSLPNTFGSLGYILKLKIKLVPVKPFVQLKHLHFTNKTDYFAAITEAMKMNSHEGKSVDFIDGMVLGGKDMHLTIARFVNKAPYTSNYKYMRVYYKSIPDRSVDYLTARDFIWRWDTDWVWGSKAFGMQVKPLRLLLGKFILKSSAYWKLVNLDRRYKIVDKLKRLKPAAPVKEAMVQDAEVTIDRAGDYLEYFLNNFDLRPVWVCPMASYKKAHFEFSGLKPGVRYINYGFWGSVTSDQSKPKHYFNKKLEASIAKFNGSKALYSTNFYSTEEFWRHFDKKCYDLLKSKYDPKNRLKGFYQKVCKEQI